MHEGKKPFNASFSHKHSLWWPRNGKNSREKFLNYKNFKLLRQWTKSSVVRVITSLQMTDNSLEPDLRNQRKAGKDRTEERSPVIRGLNQGQLKIWMELSIKLQKKPTGKRNIEGIWSPPKLVMANFECSVHFFRGPWLKSRCVTEKELKINKSF